jgi:biofilm PGA synthesis N-glycosyltransferase PgaC
MKISEVIILVSQFVYIYPLLMSFVWMIGGLIFWFKNERRAIEPEPLKDYPFFSVLVPCHNEEAHITETVNQLLEMDYPDFEIIVIDDGSTDQTKNVINNLCKEHPSVRGVYLQENQGKAAALSIGASVAIGHLFLTIDADALVDSQALKWMAWHFEKFPRVGAVTGNPRIINRTSLLAKIQTGEYSTIIGLIKRTQRIVGKVLTVSGVIAAFRKQALFSVGFWDTNMVTEDIDITWKLEKHFWDIRYEPKAICWIYVPETIMGLWRQRFRWSQGGVEVLKKHRDIWKDWRQRRLWPIFVESIFSIIWAYSFWVLTSIGILTAVFSLALPIRVAPPIPPQWTGALLALVCIIQFMVSMFVDRSYEKNMLRYLFWVIWYPFMYWMISSFTVIFAAPKAVFKKKETRAVWKSPDRGLGDIKSKIIIKCLF